MNSPTNPNETDLIARKASEWLIKRDRGLTGEEQDEFFQWLAADPRHGEWFARQLRTWKDFNQLAQWRPEHSAEPNPDLLARNPTGKSALSLSNGLFHGRHWITWAAPLAMAAGLALTFLWTRQSPATLPVAPAQTVAQGYERRVLEDGSVVELNRGARIEVNYLPAERRVRLVQGEASFTVAKNHDRPFIVRAGGVDVRAVGTAFNVRLDAQSVEVLVTEGKVRVDDAARGGSLLAATVPGETPVLVAGQKVTVEAAPIAPVAAAEVSTGEVAELLAWKPVLLDFNSLPLGEVVVQFNRRNRTQLVLADEALAALPIVASFRSDNVEGFVRLLELTSGVTVERRGDTITLKSTR
jgi:transmembrane sensor